MAERRRPVRSTRRRDDDELPEEPDDELDEEPEDDLAEEPDDELDEEPEDDLAEEPDDELDEEPEDDLAEEPDDELDEEPDDEAAEEEPERASDGHGRGSGLRRSRPSRDGGLTAAKAGQLGLRQVAELTGKETEGVTGVARAEDGWIVGVEVVEDRRIPSSTDILAIYETEVDMDGELVSYRRVRRYTRGRGDSEDL
jgi:Gas vesicle synthesis protein GvpO